jgi:hypothetical protein
MSKDGTKKVVLVGHCVPDSFMLKGVIEKAIPGAAVVRANSDAELKREAAGAALLVVNRVLDGEFADEVGFNVVRAFAAGGPKTMLISNFPEALAEAEELGAVPGFGKKTAGSEEAAKRLREAVGG